MLAIHPQATLLSPSERDSEVTCTSTHQKWSKINLRQTIKFLDLISYLFCFLSPSSFTYLVSSVEIMRSSVLGGSHTCCAPSTSFPLQ